MIKGFSVNSKVLKNGVKTKDYEHWYNMAYRTSTPKEWDKYPRYKDCRVCDEWHSFENFKQWFDENYYEVDGESMCLDKDILVKGNKIYSPETCCFVPNTINVLFTKNNAKRGKYPIGVCYDKESNKFMAQLSYQENRHSKKKRKKLGRFATPEQAFDKYKQAKEEYIKIVADRYKDEIPKILYDALYNYKVEIGD